jgi:hypothetical protein
MKVSTTAEQSHLRQAVFFLFLVSVIISIWHIASPNYGGDELFFGLPLASTPVRLRLFQFVYEGPLKTIIMWPIFTKFGFNIYTVRLFAIGVYVATALIWFAYLWLHRMRAAALVGIAIFACNADIVYYGRIDYNQAMFHDFVIMIYFVIFIMIILSFININNHIRNIWIANAFLGALLMDVMTERGVSRAAIFYAIRNYWSVFIGWGVSVCVFAYVIIRFRNDPNLQSAISLGADTTWLMRVEKSAPALLELVAGGRVLAHAYGSRVEASAVQIVGALVLLALIPVVARLVRGASDENDWPTRLARISYVCLALICLQFFLTKSAIWPWHGNSVILFTAISLCLSVEYLSTRRLTSYCRTLVAAVLFSQIVVQAATYLRSARPRAEASGFQLGVWNVQALDKVREYILNRPGNYLVADWTIARPLALEFRFTPKSGTSVEIGDKQPDPEWLSLLPPQALVVRAVGQQITTPDLSDEELRRVGYEFHRSQVFCDQYGRTAYEVGGISRIRP